MLFRASNLLFLACSVPNFLIFGVLGEFETLAVIFVPLAVFCSIHITLSYCGDEDTVRARFPRMRGNLGVGLKGGRKINRKRDLNDRADH